MNKQADGPYGTWPVRTATTLGWELTSFGFASTALFDPPVARLIRDRPADVISLCLGINVLHTDTFNRRSLVPAVIGFLDTIREGRPKPRSW